MDNKGKKIIAIGKITRRKSEVKLFDMTRYDLPCHCLTDSNTNLSFISSGSFNGQEDVGRYHASVCLKCGRLHVFTYKNGQSYQVSLHIYLLEQAKAIMDYAEYVNEK